MKYSFKEVIELLKRKDIAIDKIQMNDTTFNTEQIKAIHLTLLDNMLLYQYLDIEFKYVLSRRRALIVLLEENYYNKPSYDFDDLSKYERIAKVRFKINNSNKDGFDTPTKIHPKQSWIYYNKDETSHQKRQYIEALRLLISTPFYYFKVEEAIETISYIYKKILELEA